MKNKKFILVIPFIVFLMAFMCTGTKIYAYAHLNTSLQEGSRGAEVTNLQTFLASNYSVYPQGLVTGYYGPLTKNAVIQFQIGYALPVTGKVDNQTLFVLNVLVDSGKNIDVNAPTMSGVTASVANQTVTVSWNNSEAARSKVFYSTSPILMLDAMMAKTEPFVSGTVSENTSTAMSKNVVLEHLLHSTVYYYVVESIDESGNVTITLPQIFVTT